MERILKLLKRVDWSVLLALVFSLAFFGYVLVDYVHSGSLTMSDTAWWAMVAVLLFIVLFGILRVLAADVRRDVLKERAGMKAGCATDRSLLFFVVFKALIRCITGVNLVLLWIAGLLAILDRFSGDAIATGLLLAVLFSGVILVLAFGLVTFMDRVNYPCD